MEGKSASEIKELKELSSELVNRNTEELKLERINKGSPF
jgi:hypothetical protein